MSIGVRARGDRGRTWWWWKTTWDFAIARDLVKNTMRLASQQRARPSPGYYRDYWWLLIGCLGLRTSPC